MTFYQANNTKQQAKKVAEYATYCNELLNNVYVNMIELFKKWDGKKINIRFTQQLQELLPQKTTYYNTETNLYSVDIYKESYSDKKYISINLRISEPEVLLNYNTRRIRINDLGFIKEVYIKNDYLTSDGKIIADMFIEYIKGIMIKNYHKELKYIDAYENFDLYQKTINDIYEYIKNSLSYTNPLFIPKDFQYLNSAHPTKWDDKILNLSINNKK